MDAQKLESGLRQSVDQYSLICLLLQKMEGEIGTASQEALRDMNILLAEMQEQAAAIDQLVMAGFAKDIPVSETILSLMNERQRIINDVLLMNRNVTVKAMGVKSLLAHEIGTLRSGKSALSGYRPQQHNQGRIVNRAL